MLHCAYIFLVLPSVFGIGQAGNKQNYDKSQSIIGQQNLEAISAKNFTIQQNVNLDDHRSKNTVIRDKYPAHHRNFEGPHGYPFEAHTVQTDDGYLLQLNRIPRSPNSTFNANRQPILLMHGIMNSATVWVLMGPNISLAYMLADVGYDVWLGNARGVSTSRRHKTLDPDRNREFWDFSWHEIGVYDLPAMIDYVLNNTGFQKLHYIGHSQGTTSFFVMASERPEYNNKVLLMQALAPIAFMHNLYNPVMKSIARVLDIPEAALNVFGHFEYAPFEGITTPIFQAFCGSQTAVASLICQKYFFLTSVDSEPLDAKKVSVILKIIKPGCSTRQLIHYGQLIRSDRFCQYDFGMMGNLNKYGSHQPPDYKLDKIIVPVALHYSQNDWMSAVVDVKRLNSKLPNVIELNEIPDLRFNHFDYVFAKNIRSLLYNRIVELIDSCLKPNECVSKKEEAEKGKK